MKETHIAFLLNGLDNAGGTERVAANLAAALVNEQYRVTLVSPYPCESFLAIDPNVEIRHLGMARIPSNTFARVKWFFQSVARLRRWLKQNRPQVVFSMFFNQSIALALAGHRLPIKRIACEHIYYHYHNAVRRTMRRFIYPRLDGLVVLTERDAAIYRNFLQCVEVIPNFVEIQPADVVELPRSNTLLAVGRFSDQKGFDLLLEAYYSYTVKVAEAWSLTIVGDGPLRQQIEARARDMGVLDKIRFTGMQRNVEDFFREAGIFVLSSRFEAFPMVLLEALGSGLPVISFDCPTGPREILADGQAGMLVTAEDSNALADGMVRLTADAGLRHRLAHAGYDRVQSFSRAKILGAWRKLIATTA
ncbi:glycosyltransferase family 4 protein [Cupriavidus nantongensis]|uniref:Glycosyl transferase n=1 Tax=Cupriavidus nantongensis TaxID=1796606 RepID=A0A142JN61_9BURK|nr:glycosyltransferase family 4 protein [Cupriavidus nantongensis]AMR79523.1 hypothetical protein A2G96_18230 [Cupriavidus nantongensis]